MKRLLFLFLTILSATVIMASDSLNVRKLFAEMPDSVIPYLTKNNRLDLIDFMDSNMKAEVTNELGGKSLMTALTDDSLSLRLNDACQIQLMLVADKRWLCLVSTIGVENEWSQSVVDFYTTSWQRLETPPKLGEADQKRIFAAKKELNIVESVKKRLNKE